MPTKLKDVETVKPATKHAESSAILKEIRQAVFGLESIGGLSTRDREVLNELRQKIETELSKASA